MVNYNRLTILLIKAIQFMKMSTALCPPVRGRRTQKTGKDARQMIQGGKKK